MAGNLAHRERTYVENGRTTVENQHYLRQNPGKLVELASLLGHESLDTTALYTRPSLDDLAEDLERSRLNVYG